MPSSEYDVLIVDWAQKYRNFVGVKKIPKSGLVIIFEVFYLFKVATVV